MGRGYNINITTSTESTGSGDLPLSKTTSSGTVYILKEKTDLEIETIFKEKYPLEYIHLKQRFNKKIRKLLKANEEAV